MSTILNKKWLSDQILNVSDNYYKISHFYNLLFLICINRFIWRGLPEHIDIDFIERELANNGELAFINHKDYGFQICYCMGDYINMYGRPTKYLCWTANNVINEYFDSDDIVIIRNNKLSQTSHDFIRMYATLLSEIQKTKEVNLNAQKTPILIQCPESQLLTLKNLYAQYEGNSPVIFGNSDLNLEGLTVLKTDAPFLADKLQTEKFETLNECVSFMGINPTPRKKERMITDEVNANNDMINIFLSIFLNPRLEAIEKINKKWGAELKEKIYLELADFCKEKVEPKEDTKGSENNE